MAALLGFGAKKLWVKIGENGTPSQVPTKDCDNVDDFKDAIKTKFSHQLNQYDSSQFDLYIQGQDKRLEPDDVLSEVRKHGGTSKNTALIVIVPEAQQQSTPAVEPALKRLRLDDKEAKFDVSQLQYENGFMFRFVERLEFTTAVNWFEHNISRHNSGTTHAGEFHIPLIGGMSGSGKTRLGVEVCRRVSSLHQDMNPITLFFDMGTVAQVQEFTGASQYLPYLAELICPQLLPRGTYPRLPITLDAVLKKLQIENKVSLIMIHIDEYKTNQNATANILRACRDVFKSHSTYSGVLILPIVTGVSSLQKFVGFNGITDSKLEKLVLGGMDVSHIDDLQRQLMSELSVSSMPDNLRKIALDLGGLPRAYQYLVTFLKESRNDAILSHIKSNTLSAEQAKRVFHGVINSLDDRYKFRDWHAKLSATTDAGDGVLVLNKLFAYALAGVEIPVATPICENGKTFEEVGASGLFSLIGTTATRGKLYLPLIFAYVLNKELVRFADDDVLDPFVYNFSVVEDLGLISLATRINASFYANGCQNVQVAFHDLLPGIMGKAATLQKKVMIQRLVVLRLLHAKLSGSLCTEVATGSRGHGEVVSILNGDVCKTGEDENAIDGLVVLPGIMLLFQSKSIKANQPNQNTVSPSELSGWLGKIEQWKQRIQLPADLDIVVEVFTLRKSGGTLQTNTQDVLPDNVLYVNQSNIEVLLGPILSQRLMIPRE